MWYQHRGVAPFWSLGFHETSVVKVIGSELCGGSLPQSICRTMQWQCLQMGEDHGGCLSQGFYSCANIMTKKQVGEERVFSAYTSYIAVHHRKKSGLELKQVRKQELMQKPGRDVLYWLASPGCSACSHIEPKTTSPEMAPPTRGLSHLITN